LKRLPLSRILKRATLGERLSSGLVCGRRHGIPSAAPRYLFAPQSTSRCVVASNGGVAVPGAVRRHLLRDGVGGDADSARGFAAVCSWGAGGRRSIAAELDFAMGTADCRGSPG